MNRLHAYPAVARRNSPFARQRALDGIEWEELPSLAEALRRDDYSSTRAPVWNTTQPMPLQPSKAEAAPEPFVEALSGLHVREITGDEVFRHFFGAPAGH